MTNREIFKRLAGLESRIKKTEIPGLIFATFDESSLSWDIVEHYFRRNARGDVVRGVHHKRIVVRNIGDYEPPVGFKGTMIIDDVLED